MTGIAVPVTLPLPSGVSLQWTATGAAVVVWCARCKVGVAIYSTVLRRDPDALTLAVEEHRECQEALRTR